MKKNPHKLTEKEVRELFLRHVAGIVEYWDREGKGSFRERLEGVAFSILVALDGGSADLPGFVVSPAPHSDDEAYLRKNGENWFPAAPEVDCDIAGELHDNFYKQFDKAS